MTYEEQNQDSYKFRSPERVNRITKKERMQLYTSFGLMLAFTILAFFAVRSEQITMGFAVPFIIILAFLQVGFQLMIFMHMKEKGHGYPALFMTAGLVIALVTIAILIHTRTL